MKPMLHDECGVFANKQKNLFLLAYVDDLLLLGEKRMLIEMVKRIQKSVKLTIGNVNEPTDFLGCRIIKNQETFTIDQVEYVDKILQEFPNWKPRSGVK